MTFADWFLKSQHYHFVPAGGVFSLAPDLWPVYTVLGALLAVIAAIDARWKIIPFAVTLPGIAAGLGLVGWFRYIPPVMAVVACVGAALFCAFAMVYQTRRGQRLPLGGGALVMTAMVGAFLGPLGVVYAVGIGGLMAIALSTVFPRLMVDGAFEMGPWLALAAAAVALHHL